MLAEVRRYLQAGNDAFKASSRHVMKPENFLGLGFREEYF